ERADRELIVRLQPAAAGRAAIHLQGRFGSDGFDRPAVKLPQQEAVQQGNVASQLHVTVCPGSDEKPRAVDRAEGETGSPAKDLDPRQGTPRRARSALVGRMENLHEGDL